MKKSKFRVAVFTSNNGLYLPNARILARSVKKFHPEWDFFLLFNDRAPESFNWDQEPFDFVVTPEMLDFGGRPLYQTIFKYSVIELCTALKGVMSKFLIDKLGYDGVIYLDPDTVVFSALDELTELLGGDSSFVLTPHLTDPEKDAYEIWSHEMAALKHGTFNLGFFMVFKNQNSINALNWWSERLLDYSFIDFEKGLFTDQKWANLMPYIFPNVVVLLDRAYNVATWNGRGRAIEALPNNDGWLVNEKPLRFYHFSGFGKDFSWANHELSRIQVTPATVELWEWYKKAYYDSILENQPIEEWFWNRKFSGFEISNNDRLAHKEFSINKAVINPFLLS
jgi:lipopolysaccharide biosynthesis glycosyltransferase